MYKWLIFLVLMPETRFYKDLGFSAGEFHFNFLTESKYR